MKGSATLAAHMPELRGRKRALVGVVLLASFAASSEAMIFVDRHWPAWSSLGHILAISVGFVWSVQFYWRRKEYLARWGKLAYRNAFARHMLLGVPVMFAAIAHTAFLPGEHVPGWAAPIIWLIGLYFLLSGVLLYVRSYVALGIDYVAALYVYFPTEAQLVSSSIYCVLRHPAYSGIVRIGIALGLWGGTWLSLLFGSLMPLALTIWLRLVEEPDLIQRFGRDYSLYRTNVPAFWPRPRDTGTFLKFLLVGRPPTRRRVNR